MHDPKLVEIVKDGLRVVEVSQGGVIGFPAPLPERVRVALARAALDAIDASGTHGNFQSRVLPWLFECFGHEIANDTMERNHRFLEESLELVQACGCTADEAHQLVDYVYGRPVGEKMQEAGGVMVTLAALCLAQKIDMNQAGEQELARIWTKVEQIRAKQAAKPRHHSRRCTELSEAISAAVQAERKRCAEIAREWCQSGNDDACYTAADIADAIEVQS